MRSGLDLTVEPPSTLRNKAEVLKIVVVVLVVVES